MSSRTYKPGETAPTSGQHKREVLPKIRTGMIASPDRKESSYVQKKESRPGIQGKVALAALTGNKTVAELSSAFGVHQLLFISGQSNSRTRLRAFLPVKSKTTRPGGKNNSRPFMPKSASLPWSGIF
jgi:hypothetical protein